MRFALSMLGLALVCFSPAKCVTQNVAIPDKQVSWHDLSPHTVQFITVDKDVKLEVLDWGGSGRPLVLLAGLGTTAHVFDNFAPKLTPEYHVYGITRRGYGASSAPAIQGSAYAADRLGDDVLAVLDALKIERPVLVGHSIAGEELSSVATRHPERVAGLIYLDAAYAYAYYDRSRGNLGIDLTELQRKLEEMQKNPLDPRPLAQELLRNELPGIERDLQDLQKNFTAPMPSKTPAPGATDLASFQALSAWFARTYGITLPDVEFHEWYESNPDGSVGKVRVPPSVPQAIEAGTQKYTDIRVPVLAIYAVHKDLRAYFDPNVLATAEASDAVSTEAVAKAFERGVPSARVVRLPHANHFVFVSNEADVLREMRAFLFTLQ